VGTKAERRAARERVATYHEARLAELIEHITAALDRYRFGEIDAYAIDETIHHYHRAASSSSPTSSIKWPPTAKPSTGGNRSRRDNASDHPQLNPDPPIG
jgi:hypothetical protein